MNIYFVSDTHGSKDLFKFDRSVAGRLGLRAEDIVVHCGDFGSPWGCEDDEALEYWRSLPCEVVVCLGNHENYDWLDRQPTGERFGARGRILGERIFAPEIGEFATLGGLSFWFFPGAYSCRAMFLEPGRTVFAQEMPEAGKARHAVERLLEHGGADFLVTHDGPRDIIERQMNICLRLPDEDYYRYLGRDPRTAAHPAYTLMGLDRERLPYRYWMFGHHHRDFSEGKCNCLYEDLAVFRTESGLLERFRL